jgi:hypothetical protein
MRSAGFERRAQPRRPSNKDEGLAVTRPSYSDSVAKSFGPLGQSGSDPVAKPSELVAIHNQPHPVLFPQLEHV